MWEGAVTGQNEQPYKYNGKELDRMHGLNMYDYGARMYSPVIGRFTTMDPLAEKYYNISPYAYCANNPVNAIDPTGMDHYRLNENGTLELIRTTDDSYDQLYSHDFEMTNNFIKIDDKKLLPQLIKNPATKYNGHYGTTNDSEDALNLFKFAADNTTVEWAVSGFETKDGNSYLVRTSHSDENVSPTDGENSPLDMTFNIHSHPGKNAFYLPSGSFDTKFNEAHGGDMAVFVKRVNAFAAKGKTYPNYYIYHPETRSYYYYDHQVAGVKIYPKSIKDFSRKRKR
jgi:RHS repeat-associated protein